jgi:hypothetical protein
MEQWMNNGILKMKRKAHATAGGDNELLAAWDDPQ